MVQIEHLRDLKKVSNLWSVHFGEVLLRDYLGSSSGTKFFIRLREVSAFRRCPLQGGSPVFTKLDTWFSHVFQ